MLISIRGDCAAVKGPNILQTCTKMCNTILILSEASCKLVKPCGLCQKKKKKKPTKLLERNFMANMFHIREISYEFITSVCGLKRKAFWENLNFCINNFLFMLQEMLYITIDPKRLHAPLVCFTDSKK